MQWVRQVGPYLVVDDGLNSHLLLVCCGGTTSSVNSKPFHNLARFVYLYPFLRWNCDTSISSGETTDAISLSHSQRSEPITVQERILSFLLKLLGYSDITLQYTFSRHNKISPLLHNPNRLIPRLCPLPSLPSPHPNLTHTPLSQNPILRTTTTTTATATATPLHIIHSPLLRLLLLLVFLFLLPVESTSRYSILIQEWHNCPLVKLPPVILVEI